MQILVVMITKSRAELKFQSLSNMNNKKIPMNAVIPGSGLHLTFQHCNSYFLIKLVQTYSQTCE